VKTKLFQILVVFIIVSCGEKRKMIFLQETDTVVSLNIADADSTLKSIIFTTDIQHEKIIVQMDSIRDTDVLIFGYDSNGESAFTIAAVFNSDTIKSEHYAESGYSPEIQLNGKNFTVKEHF
jgi:hypothetical protein